MSFVNRYLLAPSRGVRDIYMGIGGLLLVLAVIAFAGASFSFDAQEKAFLRPLGIVLAVVGGLLWIRASIIPASEKES